VLLVAGIAERLHVSAAVGAFLLGIALSGEVAERTQRLLAPIRDFAAALFFLFFGLSIDPGSLGGMLLPAAALALVTALTKLATGWWAAARAGLGPESRARAGAALVARGESSIVIAGIAVSAGVDPDLRTLAAGYVLLLAFAGPILMKYADVMSSLALRRPRRRRR
jgi:CPA2 family monovalent cation:H+ antiporter-2